MHLSSPHHVCLVINAATASPFAQPKEMFVHLSPDRRLCSSIGRTHFEIWPVEGERSWFWGKEKRLGTQDMPRQGWWMEDMRIQDP